ncbi:MAG: hypothetical protein ACI9DM_000242 [Cyclobacteriaceae bacterium]|jgi:hypothetical protein
MKILRKFYESKGYILEEIKYNFQGFPIKRRGFDIIEEKTGKIVATFEPLNTTYYADDNTGIKWYVKAKKTYYLKRITTKALRDIELKIEFFNIRAGYPKELKEGTR